MQNVSTVLKLALGLLALSLMGSIGSAEVSETPREKKPSKATLGKYDADKDGQLNEEEKLQAKEGAKAKAKQTREENLAKYDADKNGKLDDSEKAAKKADEDAAKAARKAEKEAAKTAKDAPNN